MPLLEGQSDDDEEDDGRSCCAPPLGEAMEKLSSVSFLPKSRFPLVSCFKQENEEITRPALFAFSYSIHIHFQQEGRLQHDRARLESSSNSGQKDRIVVLGRMARRFNWPDDRSIARARYDRHE